MAKRPDRSGKANESPLVVNTARLESLADAASGLAQAKRWQARKNGLSNDVEASEVRSLNHDAEARAQAEAAMKLMMAKPGKKPRGR
jgi:hypothetical protein